MNFRLPMAIGSAVIVTAALFFGMQLLVSESNAEIAERVPSPPIEMVRVVPEPRPIEAERVLPPKPQQMDEPPPPAVDLAQPGTPGASSAVRIDAPGPKDVVAAPALGGVALTAVAEGRAEPIVRILPTMPRRAVIEQVPGRVVVRFDIGPTGRVLNPRVIEAEPRGFGFEAAVIAALGKWRYRPQRVDGQPVTQKGVLIAFPFELE